MDVFSGKNVGMWNMWEIDLNPKIVGKIVGMWTCDMSGPLSDGIWGLSAAKMSAG